MVLGISRSRLTVQEAWKSYPSHDLVDGVSLRGEVGSPWLNGQIMAKDDPGSISEGILKVRLLLEFYQEAGIL